MRLFLVLCLVAPLVVLGNVIPEPTDFALFPIDVNELIKRPTEEQIKCVRDSVKKIVEENPILKEWAEEVKNSVTSIKQKAQDCAALEDNQEKKKCFIKLKGYASSEVRRVLKLLPDSAKQLLSKLREAVKNCLQSSDIEFFVADMEELTRATEEQIKCIKDAMKEIVDKHPELESWFTEVRKVREAMIEKAQKCKALESEQEKKKCFRELGAFARAEVRRIIKLLPEGSRGVLNELKEAHKKCMKPSDEEFSLFEVEELLNGPTDEQKKCVQDAISEIIKEHPEMESLIEQLKEIMANIKSKAEECKQKENISERVKCYRELRRSAHKEIHDLIKTLPEASRKAWLRLKDAIKKCFQ